MGTGEVPGCLQLTEEAGVLAAPLEDPFRKKSTWALEGR